MRPAPQDEISTWIRRLLAGWSGISRSREEANDEALLYSVLLDGSPIWAVKKAVLAYLKGTVAREDNRFAPTPPEFCKIVRGYTEEFSIEIAKIGKILDAKVYAEPTNEQKARVNAFMTEQVEGLKASGNILERDDDGNLTQASRAALAEQVQRDLRATAEMLRKEEVGPREDRPPPGLTEAAEREWYSKRVEVLRERYAAEPTPKLSDAIRATNAGRPWGSPDITLGPVPRCEDAA